MSKVPIRCIIVEDNPNLNRDIVFYLQQHGIHTIGVVDGVALERQLATASWDVVVLDLGLPSEDGLSIARRLTQRQNLGLVILTARDRLEDRLAGWEIGAHVYLVKPVPVAEIAAVVSAVHRRLHPLSALPTGPWRLLAERRELITPDGAVIPLTHRERLLLVAIASTPSRSVPRDLSLDQETGGSMDALLHRLRRKLKAHGNPIRTVYGDGIVFSDELHFDPTDDGAA